MRGVKETWRMGVSRATTRLSAAITALVLAAAAHPALAMQESAGSGEDRAEVIIWTLVAVGVSMLVLAIGYVYRRAVGNEKPPPVPILEPGQRITGD
jgi:hypothetical protein